MANAVRMLACGNPHCKSRVQSTIAVRSIGNRAYCTVKCLNNHPNWARKPKDSRHG